MLMNTVDSRYSESQYSEQRDIVNKSFGPGFVGYTLCVLQRSI